MRRLIDLLTPLAFLVAVGAWWAEREGKLPGELRFYLIGAVALVVFHLSLRWTEVAAALGIGQRQVKYGTNAVVMSVAVLAILGGLNYLAVRNPQRWDLTQDQRFSLSAQTAKIVAGLDQDVKITYFQRETETVGGRDRLKEYQVLSPRLRVEFVDPWKKPALARQYEVASVPTLVVERGDKREKITSDSEQDITNALIKVTRDEKKTVCFAEGEGERDPDDSADRGYSGARSALTRSQYGVEKVTLLRDKAVPDTCSVLVVAGPQHDLRPEVTAPVEAWVRNGGKALLMVDPEMDGPTPELLAMLASFGVEAGHDVVVDASGMGQLVGAGPITPLVLDYPSHEITRDLRGTMTAFHEARSIQAASPAPTGVSVRSLLQTSARSWGESDLTLRDPIEFDAATDRQGPVSLGVVATVEVEAKPATPADPGESEDAADDGPDEDDAAPPKPEGRLVVVGDSDFASNALIGFSGNNDLFLNTIAWLAQDADLISIRPKQPEDQRLVLTQQQTNSVVWLALGFLPGLFVVLGVVAWWRRR